MAEKVNKILHIDDDKDDFLLIKDMLSDIKYYSYHIDWASDKEQAHKFLKKIKYDLCLLDYRLGVTSGLDILDSIKKQYIDLPVIFLTGQGDEDIDRMAMEKGAIDFLVKGRLNSQAMERVIRYAISNNQSEILRREATALQHIKELAAAVAHEYSQPMQVLKVYLGLLKDGVQKKEYAEKCYNQLIRLESLTNHLRNITGIQKKEYLDSKILDIVGSGNKKYYLKKGDPILIVDDEVDVLETLIEVFSQNGFKCDGSNNGVEALELFKANEYKLIISDIMMPDMPGPVFFKNVKELGFNGLFVFITGYQVSKEYQNIIQEADAVLNKPFSYSNFLEQIEHLTKK